MPFDIRIYADAMYRHHGNYADLFQNGLRRHGIDARVYNNYDYKPCDLAVFWGHRQKHIIAGQREAGTDYLVMERGYVGDRFFWTSLGYNGLNGHAEFYNEDMPADRWEKLGAQLKPWRKSLGHYVLLLGQVKGDANLEGIDIDQWYTDTATAIEKRYPFPVVFRPHPKSRQSAPNTFLRCVCGSLESALSEAVLAVAWNSNSLVDAVLYGVPVAAGETGSMAWELSGSIDGCMQYPGRQQWAHNLAYCQWSADEIESGAAWDHLKRRYQ